MNLTVTPATRRTAIFKIMADLRFLRVGARLRVTDLMTAWITIGLRGDDLATGLNESFADGILEFAGDGKEATVSLTQVGKVWLESAEAKIDISAQRDTLTVAHERVAQKADKEDDAKTEFNGERRFR